MMMTHVDEGTLLAHLDGELDDGPAGEVERHLQECGECRAEMERLHHAVRLFSTTLAETVVPAPATSDLSAQALRRRSGQRTRNWRWQDLSRAAVLVLGFTAVASATIPGTPVNRWIRDLVEPPTRLAVDTDTVAATAAALEAAPEELAIESGVSVLPEQGAVRVVLRGASDQLRVKAVLVDGPRAGVYASGSAAGARFSTGPGVIEVVGAAGGELRIELPHAARVATVDVNGRRYLSKDGAQLRVTVPVDESADAEVGFRVLQ
jgi:hypothetical protein